MAHSIGLKRASTILAITLASAIHAPATASPGAGVTPETYVTATLLEDVAINHDRVKVQTKDTVTVRVQKLTFAPGARTGWHHHPGAVVVAVQSGLVTLTDGNCVTKTYGPGSPDGSVFVEGHDDGHEASSASGATVFVTYLAPEAVFRVEDAAQSCP